MDLLWDIIFLNIYIYKSWN